MPDSIRDNLTLGSGRFGSARINVTRFEVTHAFTGIGDIVDMVNTSRDLVAQTGRNQTPMLKDISFGVYLPICVPPGETEPDFDKDILRALYQSFVFYLKLNNQIIQFPISFVMNAEKVRSPLWVAEFPPVITSCEMSVELTNRSATYDNILTQLYANVEFYLFTK